MLYLFCRVSSNHADLISLISVSWLSYRSASSVRGGSVQNVTSCLKIRYNLPHSLNEQSLTFLPSVTILNSRLTLSNITWISLSITSSTIFCHQIYWKPLFYVSQLTVTLEKFGENSVATNYVCYVNLWQNISPINVMSSLSALATVNTMTSLRSCMHRAFTTEILPSHSYFLFL